MTLTAQVADQVIKRKAATADDLWPLYPDRTLEQIVKALEQGRRKGQLHRAGRVSRGLGRPATLYAPGPEPKPERGPAKRVPTCVWDLGLT